MDQQDPQQPSEQQPADVVDQAPADPAPAMPTEDADTMLAEGLSQPSAVPDLRSVAEAQADLAANPGRTASLSEAGYVVRDGGVA